jgi:hypothetical protein
MTAPSRNSLMATSFSFLYTAELEDIASHGFPLIVFSHGWGNPTLV